MGICTSAGVIRDFAGPYYVSEDNMAFGKPVKYWKLDPNKVYSSSPNAWDTAVHDASEEYKHRMHNLCCDNCHSHVALALNLMRYDNSSSWNMVKLCFLSLLYGKYVRVLSALCGRAHNKACPAPCECSEPARTVKCVLKELKAVPAEIPRYTRNLFITSNQIALISSQDFQGLPNLVTLSLANNRISAVESQAFSALPSLRYLDLSNNRLATIHPDAFSSRNNSIRELNLSRSFYNSSAIRPVAAAIVQGGFRSLSKLELTNNEIVYLPLGMFSSLRSLRHLDLRNNSLVDIKNSTFAGLHLEHLDLTLNALKTLRIEALAELGRQLRLRLFLRDNPFVCNCDIEDLVSWLNQSQQVADMEKLVCVFPRHLQNTSLLDLAGAELGCHSSQHSKNTLQTSYVFLGIVLGIIGTVFLFVLFLNRRGIKTWVNSTRDACRDFMEEYRYRYEIDSDPRVTQVATLDI
ncbi:Trophoblast glycoprotein [Chelonia mydas]|uniref:Trophoblast glycoprotein n=1 Tax=Chelonia mydas TaxID=8469 RepID=M7B6B7_CHEMY|nr:Trophoblast glycoprotein [Chelonia mydas]